MDALALKQAAINTQSKAQPNLPEEEQRYKAGMEVELRTPAKADAQDSEEGPQTEDGLDDKEEGCKVDEQMSQDDGGVEDDTSLENERHVEEDTGLARAESGNLTHGLKRAQDNSAANNDDEQRDIEEWRRKNDYDRRLSNKQYNAHLVQSGIGDVAWDEFPDVVGDHKTESACNVVLGT
jgi:hypothetical protein